jgi:hypothetical protein
MLNTTSNVIFPILAVVSIISLADIGMCQPSPRRNLPWREKVVLTPPHGEKRYGNVRYHLIFSLPNLIHAQNARYAHANHTVNELLSYDI